MDKATYISAMLHRNNIDKVGNKWERTYQSGLKEDVSEKALQNLINIFAGSYDNDLEINNKV